MKFRFYGQGTSCGDGFIEPTITKECSFEDAMKYLENGVVANDELSRAIKIIEFKKVED